ncbi:hypothetical protein [Clostridium beijerinckii]|jgi:hypothetical protein|uniref:hypothetical protein n=1 Tax=Clostridium beijerinckii TaxID=1520 RepID=UPI001361522D|nr:hypothetical protein [Clostridium beijerinckii]MZK53674.1 hypothetical protein [Clostridium beijerinckii]MZK61803.1 hypothetical protein [Clostridium beijerinckii]MZK71984.1 hypothetical protein [Clostridium beijerinckii]MZK77377.1 hypothetical protein [Clostridium beijerinckii]MZK86955.1 hypothetical protein [Clostridium beijerinckii]
MFEVIDFINRKKAGMSLLCNLIAKDFEQQAQSNAKWTDRTANARQGLNGGSEGSNGDYTIYVAHGVDYGEILEEGSKPHEIRPKNAKGLYWKGAAHPMKVVHHPGTKGFHTIEDTLNENKDKTIERIREYWED